MKTRAGLSLRSASSDQPRPGQPACRDVGDEHVGVGDQGVEPLPVGRRLEVEDHPLLPAVQVDVEQRLVVGRAGLGRVDVDLDDLGAQVGQQAGDGGSGHHPAQVEHLGPGQRRRAGQSGEPRGQRNGCGWLEVHRLPQGAQRAAGAVVLLDHAARRRGGGLAQPFAGGPQPGDRDAGRPQQRLPLVGLAGGEQADQRRPPPGGGLRVGPQRVPVEGAVLGPGPVAADPRQARQVAESAAGEAHDLVVA